MEKERLIEEWVGAHVFVICLHDLCHATVYIGVVMIYKVGTHVQLFVICLHDLCHATVYIGVVMIYKVYFDLCLYG